MIIEDKQNPEKTKLTLTYSRTPTHKLITAHLRFTVTIRIHLLAPCDDLGYGLLFPARVQHIPKVADMVSTDFAFSIIFVVYSIKLICLLQSL
jgi:hypothetical protein